MGVGVGVSVAVGVGVGVGVTVGVGVELGTMVSVGGSGVRVSVGDDEGVTDAVKVAVSVFSSCASFVGVALEVEPEQAPSRFGVSQTRIVKSKFSFR